MRTRFVKRQSVEVIPGALLRGSAAAALSSLLLVLAHSTWGSGYWALIALIPVLMASRIAGSARYALLFGVIASIGPASLMFESITVNYPMAAILAFLTHAPQTVLPLLAWSFLQGNKSVLLPIFGFSGTWVLWEQIRMHPLISGELASFYSIAYSQVDTGLLQNAGYGGTTWTSLLILLCNSILASHVIRGSFIWSVPMILILAFSGNPHTLPDEFPSQDNSAQIQIVQPAWTQAEHNLLSGNVRHQSQYLEQMVALMNQSQNDYSYILLPEASLPTSAAVRSLQQLISSESHRVVAGAALQDVATPTNSVVLIDKFHTANLYQKWQLVPVYETPFFSPGNHVSMLELDSYTVGFLVCMDGTIDWLMEQTVHAGADVVAVLSASDYGRGYSTPELHLRLMQAQALLHRISIIFVSSNGPSAFITPDGVIRQRIDEGVQGHMSIDLQRWERTPPKRPWYNSTLNPAIAVALAGYGLTRFRRETA